mgnify:CR=1 FL=1
MYNTNTFKLNIHLEQLAVLLRQLDKRQVLVLEELLDKKTADEVLTRVNDGHNKHYTHQQMVDLFE